MSEPTTSTGAASTVSEPTVLLDIELQLPEIWSFHELDATTLARTEGEIAEMLAGKVDDPAVVAHDSVEEFMNQAGGGGEPLLLAGFREEMDDGSMLTASLTVSKNGLGGSLEPWRDAYPDADDVEVLGDEALRTFEQTVAHVPELFEEPLTMLTWRYIVPFDVRSVLLFAFTTPNAELDDLMLDHFEFIMSGLTITPSDESAPETATGS